MDDKKSSINLERLMNQVILLNPKLKESPEKLPLLNKKLEEQLVQNEAVVVVETMESVFDPLAESLIRKINQLKNMLSPSEEGKGSKKKGEKRKLKSEKVMKNIKHEAFQSDSSDDEFLITKKSSLCKRKKLSNFQFQCCSSIKGNSCTHYSGNKQDSAVSASGIIHHCVEDVIVEPGGTTHSFHIKVPSLFKGAVHELNFSGLDVSRKIFDARAQEVKRKLIYCSSQKKKSSQKRNVSMVETADNAMQQERNDAEISQLLNDVIGASGNEDETLKATNALENINNDIIDNYDVLPEFLAFEPKHKALKRHKASIKQSSEQTKKRGRKPKIKDYSPVISQPPTKSNLAQYVENFGNDCHRPGSTTPAASSTMSQPLVSSTTQNFELIDQHESSPIMYYLDGNWANVGPYQLVPANGLTLDNVQIQTNDMTVPYQDTEALNGSINMPIVTQFRQFQQSTAGQNALAPPIINIQIPPLHITPSEADAPPPPAHSTEGILDLSLKSNLSISNTSTENVSMEYVLAIDKDNIMEDMPLDLSVNSTKKCVDLTEESQCIDNGQDDDFIRRLIETSDFNMELDDLRDGQDDKSFKAALDMPLLDREDVLKDSTGIDSNYVSMTEDSPNFLSCTTDEGYHFADQSTREIFHHLLEIDETSTITTTTNTNNDNNPDEYMDRTSNLCLDGGSQIENTTKYDSKNNDQNKKTLQDSVLMEQIELTSTQNTKTNIVDDRTLVKTSNPITFMKCAPPKILKRRHTVAKNIYSSNIVKNHKKITTAYSDSEENFMEKELTWPKRKGKATKKNLNQNVAYCPKKITSGVNSDKVVTRREEKQVDFVQQIEGKYHDGLGDDDKSKIQNDTMISKDNNVKSTLIVTPNIKLHKKNSKGSITDESDDTTVPIITRNSEGVQIYKENKGSGQAIMSNMKKFNKTKGLCTTGQVVMDNLDAVKNISGRKDLIEHLTKNNTPKEDSNCHDETVHYGKLTVHNKSHDFKKSIYVDDGRYDDENIVDDRYNIFEDKIIVKAQSPITAIESCRENNSICINTPPNSTIDSMFKNNIASNLLTEKPNAKETNELNETINGIETEDTNEINKIDVNAKILEKAVKSNNNQICMKLDHSTTKAALASRPITYFQKETCKGRIIEPSESQNVQTYKHLKKSNGKQLSNVCMSLNVSHNLNVEIKKPQLSQNVTQQANIQGNSIGQQHTNIASNSCKCDITSSSKHSDNILYPKEEKVVFSIPKINLNDKISDLDYMFLSDNDGGKSLYGISSLNKKNENDETGMQLNVLPLDDVERSDVKNSDYVHQDFNRNTVENSSLQDGNPFVDGEKFCRPVNEDENQVLGGRHSFEKHCQEKEDISESNENTESESTKAIIPYLNMSVLEMESILDQKTLNLEDDEDSDALILDTPSSCFNSPNEDRLRDTLAAEDHRNINDHAPVMVMPTTVTNSDTNTTIKETEPMFPSMDNVLRINVSTNSPSRNGAMKNFKIPKLNICRTTKPAVKAITQSTVNDPIGCSEGAPENYEDFKIQPHVLLERISAKVGTRINVKDYNEKIKTAGDINLKSKRAEVITRTIKNEYATTSAFTDVRMSKELLQQPQQDSSKKELSQQPQQESSLKLDTKFKRTFNNTGTTATKEKNPVTRFNSSAAVATPVIVCGSGGKQIHAYNDIYGITAIFGITCLPFLVNTCRTRCQKSHQFHKNDIVFSALNSLNKFQLYEAYSFAYNHFKLFRRFFVVFSNLYSLRNDREKLLNMIHDCERYPDQAEFLIVLYERLLYLGLSPSNACRQILKRVREKSTPFIDMLVTIIMKSDWTMFSDYIERYTNESYKYNFRIGILEQMAPGVLNSKQTHLIYIFSKCVQTLHCDDLPRLCACSSSLMQCFDLMSTVGGTPPTSLKLC